MKAISQIMWIVVTIIVILIAALVILSIFGINIANIGKVLNDWITSLMTNCGGLAMDKCKPPLCQWTGDAATGKCITLGTG